MAHLAKASHLVGDLTALLVGSTGAYPAKRRADVQLYPPKIVF